MIFVSKMRREINIWGEALERVQTDVPTLVRPMDKPFPAPSQERGRKIKID